MAGNLVLDTLVRTVPESPPWNASYWVESIEQHLGGNGANTSYTVAMLGVPARLSGLIGQDRFGVRVLEILNEAGVDTGPIGLSSLPTASSVALVREDGARSLLHCPGASETAFGTPLEMTPKLVAGCGFFHLANPFGVPGLRSTAPSMLERARKAGLRTSLDAGWDSRGEWMKVFEPCLPFTDLLFVNRDEALHLTGIADAAGGAEALRSSGAACVAVKLGADGCAVFSAEESGEVPGFPVQVVDTTGAGDCFAGGYLAALARGFSFLDAAHVANAVGALSVSRLGSVSGVPDFDEVLRFMKA